MWLPHNSLPRNRFDTRLESEAAPVPIVFEGPLYGPSGIAEVGSFGHFACSYVVNIKAS